MTDSETGLPSGWEIRNSNSKKLPYFFNASTRESRWEPPEGSETSKLEAYLAENDPNKKIRAAHLLVKHKDSRRPSSWKEENITRTKAEAIEILEGYEKRIRGGEVTLGELASEESDCSSAKKKGDLGFFGRGDMQKEFETKAFSLKPGEVSDVVETASGVHLIERLE